MSFTVYFYKAFFAYGTYEYDTTTTHSADWYVFDLESGFRILTDQYGGNVDHSNTQEWSGNTAVVPAFYFDCKRTPGGD